MNRSTYLKGMTIVELLVTIAIVTVLAAIAAPSFDQVARLTKLDADTERFQSALALARSEAVKRHTIVSIVPSPEGYAGGWQIITDDSATTPNCSLSIANGEQLLRVQTALAPTTTFLLAKAIAPNEPLDCETPPGTSNACISFDAEGSGVTTTGASLTQVFCLRDSASPGRVFRALALNRTGQTYLLKVKS